MVEQRHFSLILQAQFARPLPPNSIRVKIAKSRNIFEEILCFCFSLDTIYMGQAVGKMEVIRYIA